MTPQDLDPSLAFTALIDLGFGDRTSAEGAAVRERLLADYYAQDEVRNLYDFTREWVKREREREMEVSETIGGVQHYTIRDEASGRALRLAEVQDGKWLARVTGSGDETLGALWTSGAEVNSLAFQLMSRHAAQAGGTFKITLTAADGTALSEHEAVVGPKLVTALWTLAAGPQTLKPGERYTIERLPERPAGDEHAKGAL